MKNAARIRTAILGSLTGSLVFALLTFIIVAIVKGLSTSHPHGFPGWFVALIATIYTAPVGLCCGLVLGLVMPGLRYSRLVLYVLVSFVIFTAIALILLRLFQP